MPLPQLCHGLPSMVWATVFQESATPAVFGDLLVRAAKMARNFSGFGVSGLGVCGLGLCWDGMYMPWLLGAVGP